MPRRTDRTEASANPTEILREAAEMLHGERAEKVWIPAINSDDEPEGIDARRAVGYALLAGGGTDDGYDVTLKQIAEAVQFLADMLPWGENED